MNDVITMHDVIQGNIERYILTAAKSCKYKYLNSCDSSLVFSEIGITSHIYFSESPRIEYISSTTATQAEEAAILEAEMEKIEIEFQTREKVRKLKAEAALAERKAELMQEYDSDDMSSSNDENGSDRQLHN